MAATQDVRDEQKSEQDLLDEVHVLRKMVDSLSNALQAQHALTLASDAHNTIVIRELITVRTQLDNTKKQSQRGPTQVKARFLTLPELKEGFAVEEAERLEKERVAAEKEAQKKAEHAERELQIRQDAAIKTFDSPFSSYKKKDDLRAIARGLGLSDLTKGQFQSFGS